MPDTILTTMQTRPMTFSQAVLLRPTMYTLEGTLPEILAFLEGYHSGIAKGHPYDCNLSLRKV